MQKYRKWTDQATGINPFIIADQKKYNLVYNIATYIKSLFIIHILIFALPLIIVAELLPFLSKINSLILAVCGNILSYDDNKFNNDINKLLKRKSKIILSNFSSLMDVFYFMFKIPGVQFLVVHQSSNGKQAFQMTKGLKCIIQLISKRQPFFAYHQNQSSFPNKLSQQNFKSIIETSNQSPVIIFYENIRTNGLGTIKISKTLSEKLYSIEQDYLVCKITYTPRDQLFFNLVRSPLFNFGRSLGSLSNRSLKIRSQITQFSTIHNANELKKDVDSFMANNGSKLLETNPQDYDSFINFYHKTQKSDYVHQTK